MEDRDLVFKKLRNRAEKKLEKMGVDVSDLNFKDMDELVHDLSVYQVELEIQNEELKNSQVQLQELKDRYFKLFDKATVGFVILDKDMIINDVNNTFVDIIKQDKSDLINAHISVFLDSDSFVSFSEVFTDTLKNKKTNEISFQFKNGNEEVKKVDATFSYITLYKTEQPCVLITMKDVTEHKILEEKYRLQNAKFKIIFDEAPVGICVTDINGRFQYVNKTYTEIYGYSKDELIGQHFTMVTRTEDKDFWAKKHDRFLIHNEDDPRGEWVVRRKNGEQIIIHAEAVRFLDDDGQYKKATFVVDITDRINKEKELQKAKILAEEATKTKSRFLANMSHEMRTPLSGIVGLVDLLAGTDLTLKQKEYVQLLQKSSNLMMNIISDILDLSKIEAGKLDLKISTFKLKQEIVSVLKNLSLRIDHSKIDFVVDMDENVPDKVDGDSTRLKQIIFNIVGNAIKFTEEGYISVRIASSNIDRKSAVVHFIVKDSGIGMKQEELDNLFAPFEQGQQTPFSQAGTGLGLSISRYLVDSMDGNIWAESEPGRGSTFHFTIPFEVVLPNDQILKNSLSDEFDNLVSIVLGTSGQITSKIGSFLEYGGITPYFFEDPFEMAKFFNKECTSEVCNIVVIHKPGVLDAVESFNIFQENKERKCKINSICISPLLSPEYQKSVDKLFDNHMTIPVTKAEFYQTLFNFVHDIEDGEIEEENGDISGLKILVAEDNEINQMVMKEVLTHFGSDYLIAENGVEAVDAFKKDKYDLVLMDIRMPEMDGIEATKLIRNYENENNLESVPIIALTAQIFREENEKCMNAGMDYIITKPINISKLVKLVDTYGKQNKKQIAESENSNKEELEDAYDKIKNILFKNYGQEMIVSLVELFRSKSKEYMQEIETAYQNNDFNALEASAHKLKGAVSNFRYDKATDAAANLERKARYKDANDFDSGLADLKQSLDELENILQMLISSSE